MFEIALKDAAGAGDLRLVTVPWWRAAAARTWWWVWPYGPLVVFGVVVVLARAAARQRLESFAWMLAIGLPLGLAVLFTMYRRSQPASERVLCRVAVPKPLVASAKLAARPRIEPRVLSTPVLLLPDGRGLGLAEGDGVVPLRELGVVLELSCSSGGRIGWCSFQFDGAVDRAPCAGHLGLARHPELSHSD